MFMFMIHFELIFVYGGELGLNCIYLHVDSKLFQHHLLQMLHFTTSWSWHSCWNQLLIKVKVYFWTFNSIEFIMCMCIYHMPVPSCPDFYSFVVSLKSGRVSPPTLFLFKIILDILGPTWILGSACQFLQ